MGIPRLSVVVGVEKRCRQRLTRSEQQRRKFKEVCLLFARGGKYLDRFAALEEAKSESKTYLEKVEELEQSLFELGGEIGAGRHVPPGVRVLSLRDNPEQQWVDLRQAAMDRLKSENEALMKQLKELQENGASMSAGAQEDVVPRQSWELANKEKIELQEVLKQKELRLLRLKEVCFVNRNSFFQCADLDWWKVFTSKSAEFKEAIASVLGVKLAFFPNGQVRVTSMYDYSASFVFQPSTLQDGAKMQLVAQGEGGPQDLPDLMQYWIGTEQCIPGFLASVTLESYDKWKRESRE